jgi:pimeloyl-ACP methyl ester carboxylesterase
MSETSSTTTKPTIVLVHGAFADGSSWNGVIERLQRQGYTAIAPANPLRGLDVDNAYLASVVAQIDGPVVLVGHSYGGALISNVGTDATNVVGLVFVAAFAPDLGERLGEVAEESKDAILGTALLERTYPIGTDGETGIEFFIAADRFKEVFAADLPEEQTALVAATQRPVAAGAFSDQNGSPAWKSLPSWAVVATRDRAAGTDIVRSMARRAGSEIVEVESSHVVMVSQPQTVSEVIVQAAEFVAASRGQVGG